MDKYLEDLIAVLTRIAVALESQVGEQAPVIHPEIAAKAEKVEKAVKAVKESKGNGKPQELDYAKDIKPAIDAAIEQKGIPVVRAVLDKFGVKTGPSLQPEQYVKFLKALDNAS